jgi:type VI secretion system protein
MSSFFDRLTTQVPWSRQQCRHKAASQKFEAIKRHLETLLNTRQGCSLSSPHLGLRDFNGHDLNNGNLLEQVSADIRRTIDRYEPRIKVHGLRGVPDAYAPLELHFYLDCQVQIDNRAQQLQIELLINGHNRFTRVR